MRTTELSERDGKEHKNQPVTSEGNEINLMPSRADVRVESLKRFR